MSFKKSNNLVGWLVFAIATATYILTAEKGGSLWDCGEFVASCFKLQIPHPPGAPMFVLLGRLFIVFFGDNPDTAAKAVNIMSALASSFTILFLFWTITHFARKMVNPNEETITQPQLLTILGAGAVGSLAYTFSDSFWFSAVEGEVYALSSFFTALVFWAMLKWEHQVDKDVRTEDVAGHTNADRWIVFIFFMMGLSIGVHLLNLLTIPAIAMIYYFKRYKVSRNGVIWAFVIGCLITGIVQKFVIQYSIKGAGLFDIFFVNNLGLPFFSGFVFFFFLLAIGIWLGLRYAEKKHYYYLRLGLWCFAFMLLGYSSYLTTMIRSAADPSVDMYNVDNPMSLVGYLGREQYGDFPLVRGQVFTAQSRNTERGEGSMRYQKGADSYLEIGREPKEIYPASDQMLFPRVWDRSNDQQHADYYAQFLGIGKNPEANDPETGPYERRPSFADNIRFFIGYQTYWMYLRYFMWNFSGKQNDIQGINIGNVRDGNWISGIPFLDNLVYGPQDKMPETLQKNKAHNRLFLIPLLFGLLGMFFHYLKNRRDFLVNFLLFFFTGFAIVIYLNQPGNQPRERDYAYVGSFYAFAVWIGLAIPAWVQLTAGVNQTILKKILTYIGMLSVAAAVAGSIATRNMNVFLGLLLAGACMAALVYGLVWVLKQLKGDYAKLYTVLLLGLLAVPVWMAVQEWDDHDRSKKTMAPDLARNYLESCAPNAILFTFGDNDTYPLWFAQEVQGVRRDVRVINYSLLGIDWYINQLRYKVNDSPPIDVTYTADQILGDKLNYAFYDPRPGYQGPQPLGMILKDWIGSNDNQRKYSNGDEFIPVFPSNNLYFTVDKNQVAAAKAVGAPEIGKVVDTVTFQIPKQVLLKNDLAVLAIIANAQFARPIYFTSPFDELGFQKYLRRDGMAYRLVPIEGDQVNNEWCYERLAKSFRFGNAGTPGVYFDEENRRHLNNIRQTYTDVAINLVNAGETGKAKEVLNKVDQAIDTANMPYGMASRYNMHNQYSLMMLEAAYRAGDEGLAQRISKAVRKDLNEQTAYYQAIGEHRAEAMSLEVQRAQMMLQMMDQLEQSLKETRASELQKAIKSDSGGPASGPVK